MDYLPHEDLLNCQNVSTALEDIIRHSSKLQLRIHLGENGIQPEQEKPYDHHQELCRLQEIETRLSNVQFGQAFPGSETFQVSATNTGDMHLIAVADEDDVFLPISPPREESIMGIAKYRLSDCRAEPEILSFGRVIRHFQVEPAEGILLVVILEEEYVPGSASDSGKVAVLISNPLCCN